jgi:hypothetical protein
MKIGKSTSENQHRKINIGKSTSEANAETLRTQRSAEKRKAREREKRFGGVGS